MLSKLAKANLYLNTFGFFKVPFIWLCRPKIVGLDANSIAIKIPLKRRTKNHLSSMYFGVLAVGADVAGGFMAMSKAKEKGVNISLAFKEVEGKFIKRAESDVLFTCSDGDKIGQMLEQAISTKDRINQNVTITATCPSIDPNTSVAEFELMLSIKVAS
ncbi:DUF4442 domain-containing protein [Vibrio marisflavi]|uniref:DUF4442 domain-containing protein n=1 Tax=Vibrio marisflavi CECT 7928 TaxID=634439 RepID=A0ABM9A501_9VIBR|nr:DUF4442 domain-containing protein [Vibrio marisflavi]CAH0539758.1 hypothetical protein VMF7928_02422 [Vibrio marisflavi CECT 7928]